MIVKKVKINMTEDLIKENEKLRERLYKAIDFINKTKDNRPLEVTLLDLLFIKEILGGEEDGM